MDAATRTLLDACAEEMVAVRDGIEAVSALTTRLIHAARPEDQSAALAEAQVFDLLAQRIEGLGAVLTALAAGQTPDAATHAVTLSDMAARLSGRAPSVVAETADAGDCLLFG